MKNSLLTAVALGLALVVQTMQELGLSAKADTLIGSSEKRGISGGEKRRCSIATELVSQPRVLFLDEPTSGARRPNHSPSLSTHFLTRPRRW